MGSARAETDRRAGRLPVMVVAIMAVVMPVARTKRDMDPNDRRRGSVVNGRMVNGRGLYIDRGVRHGRGMDHHGRRGDNHWLMHYHLPVHHYGTGMHDDRRGLMHHHGLHRRLLDDHGFDHRLLDYDRGGPDIDWRSGINRFRLERLGQEEPGANPRQNFSGGGPFLIASQGLGRGPGQQSRRAEYRREGFHVFITLQISTAPEIIYSTGAQTADSR